MMYRLVALKSDQSIIGESKFPAFAIDRTIVAQLPDASLSNVDLEYEYRMLKNVFPDRFVLLISASVVFMQIEPIDDPDHGVSAEGSIWAMEGA